MSYLHVCLCTMCMSGKSRGQKRTLGTLEMELRDDCERPCWCWESIPSAPEEQPVLLAVAICPALRDL